MEADRMSTARRRVPEIRLAWKMTAPWREREHGYEATPLVAEPLVAEFDGEVWAFATTGHFIVFFQAPGIEELMPMPEAARAKVEAYFRVEPDRRVPGKVRSLRRFAGPPEWPADAADFAEQVWCPDACTVCETSVNPRLIAQAIALLPDELYVYVGAAKGSTSGAVIVITADGYKAVISGLRSAPRGKRWPA
jgi:hypothetical protein